MKKNEKILLEAHMVAIVEKLADYWMTLAY
jgi:hypothetical protein